MENWPKQKDAISFYGDPRGENGQANYNWEQENLIIVRVPWKIYTSWDHAEMRGIRLHKKCAESFSRIAEAAWAFADKSQKLISYFGLDLCGGGYNYRTMRSWNTLSMHAFGAAIDFDPDRNRFGDSTPQFGEFSRIVEFFEREGWVWGGRWKKKDGMHFQAARPK